MVVGAIHHDPSPIRPVAQPKRLLCVYVCMYVSMHVYFSVDVNKCVFVNMFAMHVYQPHVPLWQLYERAHQRKNNANYLAT